jgi:TnpA family transposase
LLWIGQIQCSDEALEDLVNAYHRCDLPKVWGSGNSAAADGTKYELAENSLLGEYSIRYGGYGGIASPASVELGYHLCYGSPADEHLVQPRDMGVMLEITNAITGGVKRPIDFFTCR